MDEKRFTVEKVYFQNSLVEADIESGVSECVPNISLIKGECPMCKGITLILPIDNSYIISPNGIYLTRIVSSGPFAGKMDIIETEECEIGSFCLECHFMERISKDKTGDDYHDRELLEIEE